MKKILLFLVFLPVSWQCKQPSEYQYKFQNPTLALDQRVNNLVSQLTTEEKIGQLNYSAPAIERLDIPAYNWWNECLHGVGRAGLATVFPQAIGMAATWNRDLLHDIGNVISDEARAKHNRFLAEGKHDIYYGLTFWTPNINIFRDPRWGRGQETYGEDPFLTGSLAVPFIKGMQGEDPKYLKLVATAKHFAVHSGPEHSRHRINIDVTNSDLFGTYLPAFEASVKNAHVASVMCAYNRFRDEPCCGSNILLAQILRDKWHFNGYVVSDCGAISDFYRKNAHEVVGTPEEAAAMAFGTGTDLNCGSTSQYLQGALEKNLISEEEIDQSVRRLFRARFKLGMFDPDSMVSFATIPYSDLRSKGNLDKALQTSRESLVLLKNDGILPLSTSLKNIAVIGPVADDYRILLGNYHGTSDNMYTPLRGIREFIEGRGGKVSYAAGCHITEGIPLFKPIPSDLLLNADKSEHGLDARYYNNRDFESDPEISRIDSTINFWWYDETPVTGKMADDFSITWEGFINVPQSGEYALGINACNSAKMYFEDSLRISFDSPHSPSQHSFNVHLEKGKDYPVRIEFQSYGNDPQAHLLYDKVDGDLEQAALSLARKSDLLIVCMGLSPYLEGEEMPIHVEGFAGGDRTDIKLPSTQENLLKKIVATGKPVVMLLMGGSAVAVNYAVDHIPGILECWYPGEFGGKAIAEVLFGEQNPSGKLPVTFYRSVNDLPDFENYSMENRTYKFFQGDVLFPFGHGLSYTTFAYNGLQISPDDLSQAGDVTVSVDVKNTGGMAGSEVVQLYVSDEVASVKVPMLALEGFEKILLQPGESRKVTFTVSPEQLAFINNRGERILETGTFKFYVGGKQPGMKGLADNPTTQILEQEFKYTGPFKTLQ